MSRIATVTRNTKETSVEVRIDLDGTGATEIATGVPFFDHMLDQIGRHGRIDLKAVATGDLEIDSHHTIEDVGIAFGQALAEALGDKAGCARFADAHVPLDEALTRAVVDLSGRPYIVADVASPLELIGTYDTTMTAHFFESVVANGRITLHLHTLAGTNTHHIHESAFKAFAVALRRAVALTGSGVPSTKGVLQ